QDKAERRVSGTSDKREKDSTALLARARVGSCKLPEFGDVRTVRHDFLERLMDSLTWDQVEDLVSNKPAAELEALLKKHRKLIKANGPHLMSLAAELNKCDKLAILESAGS